MGMLSFIVDIPQNGSVWESLTHISGHRLVKSSTPPTAFSNIHCGCIIHCKDINLYYSKCNLCLGNIQYTRE